jgi:hypothetical protein
MFIVLAILLSAAALLAVAYPILARTRAAEPPASTAQEQLDELLGQRDAVLQALRELAFDRNVGKITAEDFTAFEAHLKRTAVDSLRALDQWEAEADDELDLALERMVRARKSALATGERACPSCGRPAAPEDKFCAACGALVPATVELPSTGPGCPNCGQPYEPGARFCAGCGQARPEAAQVTAH